MSKPMLGKAIILIGVSGSGKTTYRNSLKRIHGNNLFIFCKDDLRYEFYKNEVKEAEATPSYKTVYEYAIANEREFKEFSNRRWTKLVREAKEIQFSVIVSDNLNLTTKSRAQYLASLTQAGFFCEAVVFMSSLNQAVSNRELASDKQISESVIEKQYESLVLPKAGEGFSAISLHA